MQLSPHLSLAEFTRSATAERNKVDNSLPADLAPNAKLCAERLFERIRAVWGDVPRAINSGYRNPRVNTLVGGSATSQHMAASALDLGVKPGENLFEMFLRLLESDLVYDQLIIEGMKPSSPLSGWIHCSYNSLKVRGKLDSGFDPNMKQRMDTKKIFFDDEGRSVTISVTKDEAIKWARERVNATKGA